MAQSNVVRLRPPRAVTGAQRIATAPARPPLPELVPRRLVLLQPAARPRPRLELVPRRLPGLAPAPLPPVAGIAPVVRPPLPELVPRRLVLPLPVVPRPRLELVPRRLPVAVPAPQLEPALQAGIPEAPLDGSMYGRRNASWRTAVAVDGARMTGPLLLAHDPMLPSEAATKLYCDNREIDDGIY